MQNSNLSSQIFPMIKADWSIFIAKVEAEYNQMLNIYNSDNRRIKDLKNKISEIREAVKSSRDNIEEIFKFKELLLRFDNSLNNSFAALEHFKEQNDFNNYAVKSIYERIVSSPKIINLTSEYSGLQVKLSFDNERIKRLNNLICGNKIDYNLIKELLNKYQFDDNTKKNILFYPLVMLSVKQNEIKNKKEIEENKRLEKQKFYQNCFSELVKAYQEKKEKLKDLLIICFNVREKMTHSEIDMYNAFASNPEEAKGFNFNDDIKFKIYTLAFFKIKKDIENYLDGISDLIMDSKDLDDEIVFFNEMINEFEDVSKKLIGLVKENKKYNDGVSNNVYFALDAFNRILIRELLTDKNLSSIKAFVEKVDNLFNSRIEGVKTHHMLGVENEEKLLGKNISMLITSKMKLAYIMVNKNILIVGGSDKDDDKFDRIVRQIINKNTYAIKNQIALIEQENIDYIELQNRIINSIVGEKTKAM